MNAEIGRIEMDTMSRSKSFGVAGILVAITAVTGVAAFKMNNGSPSRIEITPPKPAISTPIQKRPLNAISNLPQSLPSPAAASPANTPLNHPILPENPPAEEAPQEAVVHVAGAVKHPGLYHLKLNARNDDAVKAAGGPASGANLDAINLAAHLQDGEQLYIPTKSEQPAGGASEPSANDVASVKKPVFSPVSSGKKSSVRAPKKGAVGGKAAKLTDPAQGKVNLNTGSLEDLQKLPGIGPAMAERVIAWRKENGGFQNAEDLLQVSGIGEKKFAKIQPFIIVSGSPHKTKP